MSAILKQKLIDIANGFTKYGLWKGGGSGGSSALSDMTDVSFSNLKENDVLKYNGSVWVNSDNLHEYSMEEKIVGKWIDGKPIYEKVFEIGNKKKDSYEIPIENLKRIINYYGYCDINNLGRPIPFIKPQFDEYIIVNHYTNGIVYFTANLNYTNCVLIFRYTKTTD